MLVLHSLHEWVGEDGDEQTDERDPKSNKSDELKVELILRTDLYIPQCNFQQKMMTGTA